MFGRLAAHDGMGEAPSPAYVSDFLATSDGLALTKAFMRITDSKLRRRIVDLVEQIAAATNADNGVSAPASSTLSPHFAHILTARRDAATTLSSSARLSRRSIRTSPTRRGQLHEGSVSQCNVQTICSPANRCRKDIRTRFATRSPTPFSMPSSRTISSSASPTRAKSIPGSAARLCARPTRSSSPARAAARRRCSTSTATKRWSIAS